MTFVKTLSSNQSFGGEQLVLEQQSAQTNCAMRVGLFIPTAARNGSVPVVMWLSGLTCTEENLIVKAGVQRDAEELGIAIIAPHTSPRGFDYPGEDDVYDFGSGAGFYVDATEQPWATGYQMYSYVCALPALIAQQFVIDTERMGITGHSMGGHGALTIALKIPISFVACQVFTDLLSDELSVGSEGAPWLSGCRSWSVGVVRCVRSGSQPGLAGHCAGRAGRRRYFSG